ncbi:MAG: DUF962 domain-containing protein [Alphaproteobacteria bacterium]
MFTELYTKQLAGYASYHTDIRNELTHFIGIPLIVIGVLFVASWPKLFGQPLSIYLFVAFAVLWMSMDFLIGGIVVLLSLPFLYLGIEWYADPSLSVTWKIIIAVGLQVVGWGFQLVGHAYEGKRPALVDNLFQGLLGPTFLVYEVVHRLGLKQKLKADVDAELARLTQ